MDMELLLEISMTYQNKNTRVTCRPKGTQIHFYNDFYKHFVANATLIC